MKLLQSTLNLFFIVFFLVFLYYVSSFFPTKYQWLHDYFIVIVVLGILVGVITEEAKP